MHPFNTLAVPAGKLAVHWFGQSSFALKSPGATVLLVDPYFPHQRPPERFLHAQPPVQESDLRVDGVMVTHDHLDHTCPESLARIRAAWPQAIYAGPAESVRHFPMARIPSGSATTIGAGSTWNCGDFTAHFVYSKPPDGDPKEGIRAPDVTHLGVVLESGGVRVYITGDPINTFAELESLIAPVRALTPQIGFLTTHPTEGEFPFFAGSAHMAQRIGLQQAFPQHYACFTKRTYDPREWATYFPGTGVEPRIVGYNESVWVP